MHSIKVGSIPSYPAELQFGVPQGSGPNTVFSLYKSNQLNHSVIFSTISMPMIPTYTEHSHQLISLTLYKHSGIASIILKISYSLINKN